MPTIADRLQQLEGQLAIRELAAPSADAATHVDHNCMPRAFMLGLTAVMTLKFGSSCERKSLSVVS